MSNVTDSCRLRRPPWINNLVTLCVGVLLPVYWRDYGPANFLWFCDFGLLVTMLGLWFNSRLLISSQAIALALPQTVWIIDFLSGGHLLGLSAYMFNPAISLFTRMLSTFHIWLPILLVWLVWRMGYDRRAVWLQTCFMAAVLIASYVFTDPRHPPTRYPAAAVNVNRVYGIHPTDVQTWMPWYCFLGLHMVFWPVVFYIPTHLVFRRVFKRVDSKPDAAFPSGGQPPPAPESAAQARPQG